MVTQKTKVPDGLKPYLFHGVEDIGWTPGMSKVQATCPFCEGHRKFTINTTNSLFRCVVCDKKGNASTFIRELYKYALSTTTLDDYNSLIELRGIASILPPMESLDDCIPRQWGLAMSPLTGEWLIPSHDVSGRLRNISRYVDVGKGKYRVMSTPTLNIYPFGLPLCKTKDVFICEGVWDAMSLYITLHGLDKLHKHSVVGVPGAGNFSKKWFSYFKGKKLRICFDNDHPRKLKNGKTIQPGQDGMCRIASLNGELGHVRTLNWNGNSAELPFYTTKLDDGYDVTDLILDQGHYKALDFLLSNTVEPAISPHEESDEEEPSITPIKCESFSELLGYFEDLHTTRLWIECFAVMLATTISPRLKGNPIWVRVIGPPSSGKTLLAECLSASKEHVWALSTFSGFVSGFKGSRDEDGNTKDSSLIPMMNGKCLVVKDGDTLMSNDGKDRILAELRDLFDGVTRAHYRNQESHTYEDIRTSIILCGTNQLRLLNRANLGERFLDMEIVDDTSRNHYAKAAANHALHNIELSMNSDNPPDDKELIRKQATLGFLQYLSSTSPDINIPQPTIDLILSMAEFLAHMRARVHKEELDTAPEIEMPARLVTQMVKLAACLYIVLANEENVERTIPRILRNVMMATAKGRQLQATIILHDRESGRTTEELSNLLRVSTSTTVRILDDMKALGLVLNVSLGRNGRVGRPKVVWQLTDKMRAMVSKALGPRQRKTKPLRPKSKTKPKLRSKPKPPTNAGTRRRSTER